MSAAVITPRHVHAPLSYFGGPDTAVEIDFTRPDSEAQNAAAEKKQEQFPTKIQDARGIEDTFNLENNGFVYAKHKVGELANCTTEDEITALLVPATEKLVQDL